METAARWAADPITLDEVHRFVRVALDESGLPMTEPDRQYAALTLAMRDDEDPFRWSTRWSTGAWWWSTRARPRH